MRPSQRECVCRGAAKVRPSERERERERATEREREQASETVTAGTGVAGQCRHLLVCFAMCPRLVPAASFA